MRKVRSIILLNLSDDMFIEVVEEKDTVALCKQSIDSRLVTMMGKENSPG